jgi:hypothetical protein
MLQHSAPHELQLLTTSTPKGRFVHIANVAGHAVVGCLSTAASGGKCGSGALSAAVGAAGTPLLASYVPTSEGKLIGASVLGGLGSVDGGGKFENGAVTAAFGYLFNACGSKNGCAFFGGAIGTAVGVTASGACDLTTSGACLPANPPIAGALGSGIGWWGERDGAVAPSELGPG